MNNKIDIAICIPSKNEEKTIRNVVEIVALGINEYFPEKKAVIINADNNSTDRTKEEFFIADTGGVQKLYIATNNIGKGENIKNFLNYAVGAEIPFMGTIDSDLRSIEPIWIYKLLKPLMDEQVDYVTPVYKRNRYEGNTTNHLCYPLLFSLFGDSVRQPIAGDFAFTLNFSKYLLNNLENDSSYKYGIDITMTLTAMLNGLKLKEVYLGEKIHNSSFSKMIPMFEEVAQSLISVLNRDLCLNSNRKSVMIDKDTNCEAIQEQYNRPSDLSIQNRKDEVEKLYHETEFNYLRGSLDKIEKFLSSKILYTKNDWICTLRELVDIICSTELSEDSIQYLSKELLVHYLVRVLSYFEEIDGKKSAEVEDLLNEQAFLLKKEIN